MAAARRPSTGSAAVAARRRVDGRVRARRGPEPSAFQRRIQQAVLRSFLTGTDTYPWLGASGSGNPLVASVEGAMGDTPELADGYLQEPTVAACVDLFSLALLLARPRLWDGDPDSPGAREVVAGPLVDLLLNRPAPWLDGSQIRVRDAIHLGLTGESFWFLHDDAGNPIRSTGDLIDLPAQITPLPGSSVALESADSSGPLAWRVPGSAGVPRSWPATAAVQFFEHPDVSGRRHFRGLGRLAKAFGSAAQNHLARRYTSYRLRNNGEPSMVVIGGEMLSPEDRERYREEFDEEWNDPEHAGDTRYIPDSNAKVLWGKGTPKDMDYANLLSANRDDICAVFGTPAALLGDQAENFATFAGHWTTFVQLRVKPWLLLASATINRFIGRLRDRGLSVQRVRFDTEVLDTIFADVGQQIDRVQKLVGLGVPLDEALRQGGFKSDPIPGGDVSLVESSLVARDAAIVRSRADAAGVLIERCGVDRAAALAEVGLGHLQLAAVEAPESVEDDLDDETPPDDPADDAEDGERALAAGARTPSALVVDVADAASATKAAAGRAARDATIARAERLTAGARSKIAAGFRKVFRAMRTAQIRALEQFAESGTVDRAVFAFGGCPAVLRRGPPQFVAPWPAPLGRALTPRAGEAVLLLARGVRSEVWRDCSGAPHVEIVWPRGLLDKATRYGCYPQQLVDAALIAKAAFSESEIEQLLVVADQKWRDALLAILEPLTVRMYEAAAEDMSAQLGVTVIDTANPAVLAALKNHAIQVVEGTTSVVAQRMRSDIIRVLAGASPSQGPSGASPTGLATLQQAIHDSLVELKATTTAAFNDHFARALAIARTETGRASNQAVYAQMVAAHEAGALDEVEWSTSGQPVEPDGPTRREHFETDGQRRVPGLHFDVAGTLMLYPHDPSAPARQVVNCKCTLRPIVN